MNHILCTAAYNHQNFEDLSKYSCFVMMCVNSSIAKYYTVRIAVATVLILNTMTTSIVKVLIPNVNNYVVAIIIIIITIYE